MKTVKGLKREAKENASKKVKIFNPDNEDFKVSWGGTHYTLHAQEIKEFDYSVAKHIKEKLKYHLLYKRNVEKKSSSILLKEIEKEIEVKI